MINILFVCLGNICRSPMAEFVMKDIVAQKGLAENFVIESAATSSAEVGNPVYPPVYKLLKTHGIDATGKISRQLKHSDYDKYDFIIGMDKNNLENMKRIFGEDIDDKLYLLMNFIGSDADVLDPWYTRNFDKCYVDIEKGCKALFDFIRQNYLIEKK